METRTHTAHNVVAVFADEEASQQGVEALQVEGIAGERLSFVGRHVEGDSVEEGAQVTNQLLAGGVKGGAVGGLAGVLAGALVVAVPGVGAVLGAGILGGAVAGAAAGSTVGALWGGFSRMWDMTYRDLVKEGRVLVAVHTDDGSEAGRALRLMQDQGAVRVDHFDAQGEVVQRS